MEDPETVVTKEDIERRSRSCKLAKGWAEHQNIPINNMMTSTSISICWSFGFCVWPMYEITFMLESTLSYPHYGIYTTYTSAMITQTRVWKERKVTNVHKQFNFDFCKRATRVTDTGGGGGGGGGGLDLFEMRYVFRKPASLWDIPFIPILVWVQREHVFGDYTCHNYADCWDCSHWLTAPCWRAMQMANSFVCRWSTCMCVSSGTTCEMVRTVQCAVTHTILMFRTCTSK